MTPFLVTALELELTLCKDYRGGNPTSPLHSALPEIRSEIWQNGTGSMKLS